MQAEVALAQGDQARLKGCTVQTLVFLSVKPWGRIPGPKLPTPRSSRRNVFRGGGRSTAVNGGAVGWQQCSPCQQDPKTRARGKIHKLICLGKKKMVGLGLLKLKSAQREE